MTATVTTLRVPSRRPKSLCLPRLRADFFAWTWRKACIRKQIAATQEQIRQAERERDRVKRLLEADAANRKQLDDAESLLQVLCKQLAAQNSSLQNSDRSLTWQSSSVDIQVAQVDDQLAKCRVCAPVAGTVLAPAGRHGADVLACLRHRRAVG